MSKVSRPAFTVGAIPVVIVLALVIAVNVGFPVTEDIGYRCSYCGAHYSTFKVLGLTLNASIKETDLSKYVAKHVDPHHQHRWVAICGNDNLIFGCHRDYCGGGHPRWLLQDDAALAVLKSLPSTASRKSFLKQIWGTGTYWSKSEYKMLTLITYELRKAYLDDPNRKDWLKILKKTGFKP